MPQAPSRLPEITEFKAGLITNRNAVVSPFLRTATGQKITAHDALSDGLNTEVTNNSTIARRPGWTSFQSTSAVDMWSFKDLNGAIHLYEDTGSSLITNSTLVFNYGTGTRAPLSAVVRGDFFYVANGVDLKRIQNTAPTVALPWGQTTPSIPLQITQQSLTVFNAVTGFIKGTVGGSQDSIGGLFTVTDSANNRTLTVTINASAVHFNVTFSGNQISPNQSYTQVTSETVVTGPPKVTTDTVTVVNSFSASLTGASVTNGIANYYANTGISTMDFDMVYTAPMTLDKLSALVATAITSSAGFSFGSSIPASASAPLKIFASTSVVQGIYVNPGQPPMASQLGVALNITVTPNTSIQTVSIDSGLYDITNPQLSLAASIGSAPRLYQYVSPAANVTDLFSGAINIQLVDYGTNPAQNFTFTNQTLAQIAVGLESSHWLPIYVQTGTTAYIILRNFQSTATSPGTTDSNLVINSNSLVNNNDTNENFQNWPFLSSNDYCQLPQQGIQITYAVRDVKSGGLSNTAPPVTVSPQLYPTRWSAALVLPGPLYSPAAPAPQNGYQNIELYRTVDGGSSFLFEQLINYQNLQLYFTNFSITDAGLNDQLIGPIDEEADAPPSGLRQITSHSGRMWGIVDNRVYYSGGPDTTNGNGDESWPPGNNFQFPGNVSDIKSTQDGLIVALTDDLHVITGVDSSSYYAKPWIAGYGISTPTAWDYDKQTLYLYTTSRQLHSINGANGELREIGFNIGDQLASLFPPTVTSVTFHRASSLDTALYVSNGTETIFRFDPSKSAWSPMQQPAIVGAGRVRSLETSTAVQTLLNCTPRGVFARNLTVFSDNGVAYPANVVIGTMTLAPLGQVVSLNNLGFYFKAVGTLPKVSVLLNEIEASTAAPFLQLFNVVNDPPDAPASISIWAKRFYVESTIAPFRTGTRLINLASVKVDFGSDTAANELLTLQMRDSI